MFPLAIVITASQDAQNTMAIAQIKAEWQNKKLAASALAEQAIQNLIRKNITPQFHQLILDMLNEKDQLEQYSQAQLKNIVKKELPQNSAKLINQTLEYVATVAIKQSQLTQKQINNKQLQMTPSIQNQLTLLQINSVALLELKELVTDAANIYTIKSILHQLTETLQYGWTVMSLTTAWTQAMKLRHKTQSTSNNTTKSTTTRTPRRRPSKQSLPTKQTTKQARAPKTTVKTEKITVAQRKQTQRPIGSRNGKITGTDIDFVKGKCNNFQVWNECAVLSSEAGCKWDHVCSNCGLATHGAGSCPYKKA